jgi:TPR repeat protein
MVQRTHGALVTRARRGDARAQFDLGMLYLKGADGLKRNDSVALDWLLKAVRQNHPEAAKSMIRAGAIEAVITSPNKDELVRIYRDTAEAGDSLARWSYLRLIGSQPEDAELMHERHRHLDVLADEGHRAAQWSLSQYEHGRERRFKARYWAERAAERGSAEALTWLSANQFAGDQDARLERMSERFMLRLLRDDEVLNDDSRSLLFSFWRSGRADAAMRLAALEKAATSGMVEAQFERGVSLLDVAQVLRNRVRREDGEALQRIVAAASLPLTDQASLSRAASWLEQAAAQQHADACYLLGILFRITAFAQRSLEQSDGYFTRAAECGQVDAQFWLGNKLWRERERDPAAAVIGLSWLARAAKAGNAPAHQMLIEHTEAVGPEALGPFVEFSNEGIEQLQRTEPLLAARIGLAKAFDLTRLEALLIDPPSAYHDEFLVVDLSHATPRHKRRILRITSSEQRLWLAHAVMKFRGSAVAPPEGDYRSRLYRCEKALQQERARSSKGVVSTQKTT